MRKWSADGTACPFPAEPPPAVVNSNTVGWIVATCGQAYTFDEAAPAEKEGFGMNSSAPTLARTV